MGSEMDSEVYRREGASDAIGGYGAEAGKPAWQPGAFGCCVVDLNHRRVGYECADNRKPEENKGTSGNSKSLQERLGTLIGSLKGVWNCTAELQLQLEAPLCPCRIPAQVLTA
jgi:hypothetical protein